MIEREIGNFIKDNISWFPIVSVTGPRQSGKTTLVKNMFPNYRYVNLENAADFALVSASPIDFLQERPSKMIIDEAQKLPELFNAIQVCSDNKNETGQYILSGSQNFLLSRNISQSLAGRVGMIRLLPLSYHELIQANYTLSPDEFLLKGGYPRIYDSNIPPKVFYENYLTTYLQRDIKDLLSVRNVSTFRKFLFLCAHNASSLFNASRLATDIGVNRSTIDSWLSVLEASYIVFRLDPFQTNVRKRLTKTPKLYFYDTGLLSYLLGVHDKETLIDSPSKGILFENLIVSETYKNHLNRGDSPQLFFYRDDSKVEVNLVDTSNPAVIEITEIKPSLSFQSSYLKNITKFGDELDIPVRNRNIVTRGDTSSFTGKAMLWSAAEWLCRF